MFTCVCFAWTAESAQVSRLKESILEQQSVAVGIWLMLLGETDGRRDHEEDIRSCCTLMTFYWGSFEAGFQNTCNQSVWKHYFQSFAVLPSVFDSFAPFWAYSSLNESIQQGNTCNIVKASKWLKRHIHPVTWIRSSCVSGCIDSNLRCSQNKAETD